MRAAAIQMNSGAEVAANLQLADELLAAAATDGCVLAVLPENFAFMGAHGKDKLSVAEKPGEGPIQSFLSAASSRYAMWIVGGSLPLLSEVVADRVYGACLVYDSHGSVQAMYRKIHLFDVDLVKQQESYRESHSMLSGEEPLTVATPCGRMGLTICYDLRFPELFRHLVDIGATIFTVPSAFTATTGEAHWEPLLRARAIENLAYVIAPGQHGKHPDGRSTYGYSLIIDPWGRVLAEAEAGNGYISADIDPDLPDNLRAEFPALQNRRL